MRYKNDLEFDLAFEISGVFLNRYRVKLLQISHESSFIW